MQSRSRGSYEIAGREVLAEGADLRVQVLTLASGQAIPWHYHSEIGDQMVCLDGPTGRCLTESHPGTLLCVPAVCLRRLSDIHEAEVLELSDGLLAFVGPLPGSPERQLRFAGVALSGRGGRPGELVLAAIEAG